MDTLSVVVAEQGSGCAQCIKVVRPGNIALLFVIGDGGGGRAMPMPAWAWALSMLVGLEMVDSLIDIVRQTADPPH